VQASETLPSLSAPEAASCCRRVADYTDCVLLSRGRVVWGVRVGVRPASALGPGTENNVAVIREGRSAVGGRRRLRSSTRSRPKAGLGGIATTVDRRSRHGPW